jgi:hypothetical protein
VGWHSEKETHFEVKEKKEPKGQGTLLFCVCKAAFLNSMTVTG